MAGSGTGLKFSPTLLRLQERATELLKRQRGLREPLFADADAVTAWVAAVGLEIDSLHAELEKLRREMRSGDSTPDIQIVVEGGSQ